MTVGVRPDEEGIRLQKVLAGAGLGSRRACEVLIAEGRVSIDGETVVEQGRRVDPETAGAQAWSVADNVQVAAINAIEAAMKEIEAPDLGIEVVVRQPR